MHWVFSALRISLCSSLLVIRVERSGACFALGTGCTGPGCLPHYPAYCAYRYCGASASAAAARRALGTKTIVADQQQRGSELTEYGKEVAAGGVLRMDSTGATGEHSTPNTPDEMFEQCCEAWSLPGQCRSKCNYQNYTAEALRAMFVRSDECPIEAASIIHFCSSQNRDHSLCCERSGIAMTSAGAKCMIFCEPMPRNETSLNFSYLPCLEKFAKIKECFFENALREVDYLEMEAERRDLSEAAVPSYAKPNSGHAPRVGEPSNLTTRPPPAVLVNSLNTAAQRALRINDDYGDA